MRLLLTYLLACLLFCLLTYLAYQYNPSIPARSLPFDCMRRRLVHLNQLTAALTLNHPNELGK